MKKTTLYSGLAVLLLVFLALAVTNGCKTGYNEEYRPTYSSPGLNAPLVVSYHVQGEEAGLRILNAGGSAFDAFVATVVAENVVSCGYVTLAGLLSAVTYHADTNEVKHLDAGYNSVLNPDGAYDSYRPVKGKLVVVPGLMAGLDSMLSRYGRLSWAEVLQPAIEIARDGFVLDWYWAYFIEYYKEELQDTEYGKKTFFPNGVALKEGDILKQPELAQFLVNIAEHGTAYMYTGQWAAQCVETVHSSGGLMTMEDLAAYEPTWGEPWRMTYRGHDICASSGRTMHALYSLLALKTLEHTDIQPMGHFSQSADALEVAVRVARATSEEGWIYDHRYIDDRDLVQSRLTTEYTDTIWARVTGAAASGAGVAESQHHTLSLIVADTDGNVVSGKHSINSSEYWGTALFVQGIPLNSSGMFTSRDPGPGERRTQGAPSILVFKDGPLKYALGTFGGSNGHSAYLFLVNLLDYGMTPHEAASSPRFGGFAYNSALGQYDYTKNRLDERISSEIVATLASRGLHFQLVRRIGPGCIAQFHSDGHTSIGWD